MRSARELAFRFRQEAANLRLLARPPRIRAEAAPLEGLPDPEQITAAVRGTAFAEELERLAGSILAHRIPLFGKEVEFGPRIAWRRDWGSGIETGLPYFRLVPYLDPRRAGDHKRIWELNRHQHLVVLAQAYRLAGRAEYREELFAQLEDWWEDNPFQRGINWASALEVAFRALSWIWVYHLAGEFMPAGFRSRFLTELYRHGRHLEANLSIYFSPNTHLLGEAVALHALGRLFPVFPKRWRLRGREIVAEQSRRQVRADGSHFEQSAYYHVYALDLLLLHGALEGGAAPPVTEMAQYLEALMGASGRLPLLGDDDGGRLFHPYGPRDRFGRATLATAGLVRRREDLFEQAVWWLGPQVLERPPVVESVCSRWFPDAGTAVMRAGGIQVVADAGSFGAGSGGHSHSDTLSLVVRRGEREILLDPGTYTYVGEPRWRNWFRGSAAHNTVRIGGRDQAEAAGPFRWLSPPRVRVELWNSSPAEDRLEAVCEYSGFRHRRRIVFRKPDRLLVADRIEGPPGEHEIEQFWHPGGDLEELDPGCFRIGGAAILVLDGGEVAVQEAWRSPVFGEKISSPAIRAACRTALPATLRAVLWLTDSTGPLELVLSEARSLT
ncbi:MAG: alginate lyase family protein [Bryobacterales bacterium]|nr:alginate lyase family protein [Bryobacterales bacterium]